MMSDGDNRIRLDETPVDFTKTDTTGQNHDSYPDAEKKARYDQLRSYLIGLLSHQSSKSEPLEKRIGTTWYNKNKSLLEVFSESEEFEVAAKHLGAIVGEEELSLQTVVDQIFSTLAYVGPTIIWSGFFDSDASNIIPIPDNYQQYVTYPGIHPFVYVGSLTESGQRLLEPRTTSIRKNDISYVHIGGNFTPVPEQTYTVIMQRVTSLTHETIPARG